MTIIFAILSVITIGSAVAAMSLRNLVHCALALTVTFTGLAALYLQLDAQFIGFAQILVYVGAVAILIVIAILLTRGGENDRPPIPSASAMVGIGLGLAVFGVLALAVFKTRLLSVGPAQPASPNVLVLGDELMRRYVLPLEVVGLLLTAALIGAVVLAMPERKSGEKSS